MSASPVPGRGPRLRGRNERTALRNLGTVLNQNCGPFATGFFTGGTRPALSDSAPVLSVRLVALSQLDDQPEGLLPIGIGHRLERSITAERGVTIAIDLGQLAPGVG